jgi:outer membrane translocation and assembly module TamA
VPSSCASNRHRAVGRPATTSIPAIGALGLRLSAAFALAVLTACSKIPPGRSAIDDVSVLGAKEVSGSDVEGQISTDASPKFLGLFRGFIYDYTVFDRATLQRDLARVERYYHAQGYYSAQARAGRVLSVGPGHVRVEIFVDEGPPTINRDLTIEGLDGLPPLVATAVRTAARLALPLGKPFAEDQGPQSEKDTRKALTDAGYAYATVKRDTYVDIVAHHANTTLQVDPGQTARFGAITIEGLDANPRHERLPEDRIRRTMEFKEGQPYSTSEIDYAMQALLDLEVFASVVMTPDLSDPSSRVVPVHVKVETSRLHEISLGGGFEFDEIKTELHGLLGWEDHNFLGGLRDLSVHFQPGVVFYPTRVNDITAPDHLFPEEKLRAELKQPGFIEARTEGFIRPEFNVFPLLVQTNPLPNDPVVGYIETRGAIGVDRTFWKKLYVSLSLDAQIEDPFSYKLPLDPDLSTLIIVYPELEARLDFRDDHNHPHKGFYIANDFQWATGFLGGETKDIKIQPEIRTYIPVAKKVTFATRGSIGMLFPGSNYGATVEDDLDGPVTPQNRHARVQDIEKVLFRGFYSGGSTTNRGFQLRGVGPYGIVPFLNPSSASSQAQGGCTPTAANGYGEKTAGNCLVPIGGFTLWELSNEFRFDFKGPLSAALFCDMGDVSPHVVGDGQAFRFNHLHLSCGVGARYDTPVGPIRVDVGYRIPFLQVLGYANEAEAFEADRSNGFPGRILGQPIALDIGIGEAY